MLSITLNFKIWTMKNYGSTSDKWFSTIFLLFIDTMYIAPLFFKW